MSSSQTQRGETPQLVVDLFAGPGGWSEGLRSLAVEGLTEVGIEHDMAACQTRAAAGHLTLRADVSRYPTAPFVGKVAGLIASPPCPTFSNAGQGAGMDDMPYLLDFVRAFARAGWVNPWAFHEWADERTPLILEPLRWAADLNPEWIALEQVPPCLPVWEAMARVWRDQGRHTWAGVLNAADYGVPQTRKRAFCLAHRSRSVHRPHPTHERDPQPSLFGELERWVSMATALGWGATERPVPTVTSGGAATGGPEPFGRGGREALLNELGGGRWLRTDDHEEQVC